MSSRSGSIPRPALADVTNKTRKRSFENYAGKMSDGLNQDLPVSKQVCLGLENSRMLNDYREDLRHNGLAPSLTDDASVADEVESPLDVVVVEGIDAPRHVIELDVASRDSFCSAPLIHLGSDSCNGDSNAQLMFQKGAVREPTSCLPLKTLLHADCQNSDKDIPVSYFNLDRSESTESAKYVKPTKTQSFELERCTSLKGDDDFNSAASAADMLKTCSCSFCLKAAYIWSDLHYQDVKGRINAVKKSKKEAVNLFQGICKVKETNTHGQGISDRTSRLESDLSSQWRSLFLHMEEAFARESNHLQDNYLALKELRDTCKVNLETIDAKPADRD